MLAHPTATTASVLCNHHLYYRISPQIYRQLRQSGVICRHASASQASSRRQHGGLAPRWLAELVQLVPADSSLSTSLTQHQQQRDQVPAVPDTVKPRDRRRAALLVVEAFAGSCPVARHFQTVVSNDPTQGVPYQLKAYAAIEANSKLAAKAPTATSIGLHADNCLVINDSVTAFPVQAGILEFVKSKLADEELGISTVVVFGGPPCDAYSLLRREPAMTRLQASDAAYAQALQQYAQMVQPSCQTQPNSSRHDAYVAALRAADIMQSSIHRAGAEAAAYARKVLESDSCVKSFLGLFKAIEGLCQEADKQPCYLVMENPYARPGTALWNRTLMRNHLIALPDRPAAQALPFQRRKQAFLHAVYQNWCAYGEDYPMKPTIIYTNLPDTALHFLDGRRCPTNCKHPDPKNHSAKVKEMEDSADRAKWPVEFVEVALNACAAAAAAALDG